MFRFRILLLVAFFGVTSMACLTQPSQLQAQQADIEAKPLVEVPVRWFGHHIVFDIQLDGHEETLQFLFDTGATSSVLDTETAEALGIKANQRQDAIGTGGKSNFKLCLNQTLRFSEQVKTKRIPLVLVDLKSLSEGAGTKFDGITGFDFLERYLVEIDHSNDRLRFFERDAKLKLEEYQQIPFRFKNRIPIPAVTCTIELASGDQLTGDALVDTGAALTLRLNQPFHANSDVLSKAVSHYSTQGDGLTKKSTHHVIRAVSLSLGDFKFDELQIQLSTSKSGVTSLPGFMGLLGNAVLRRFDIVLDYQTKTMYCKPTAKFDDPFWFNTSGVSLHLRDEKIYVRSVVADSPGVAAGIQPGWQLISIDGQSVGSLNAAKDLFRVEGKTLALQFRTDDGEGRAVNLPLTRLLQE